MYDHCNCRPAVLFWPQYGRACDRIIYLEKGKIVEDGSYDELIALNGRFADLVERQRLDK